MFLKWSDKDSGKDALLAKSYERIYYRLELRIVLRVIEKYMRERLQGIEEIWQFVSSTDFSLEAWEVIFEFLNDSVHWLSCIIISKKINYFTTCVILNWQLSVISVLFDAN